MDRRRLAHSTLALTPMGLGAWAIGGGDWILGWGPQPDAQSVATIRRAIDCGINWVDTAAVYGLGRSESIVARALRGVPHRDRPYVFTKCGFVWDDLGNVSACLEPSSIRRQAENSLRRLAVETIDLYQLDSPPPDAEGSSSSEAFRLDAAWETLAALRREGKARFIGLSNCDPRQLDRLERIAPITCLQVPYSLLRRGIEDATLPYCEARGIGVVVSSPMESGLLTGAMTPERLQRLPHNDWRRRCRCFQEAAESRAHQLIEQLGIIAASHGCTPGAVAVAWTLQHHAITAAVVGARRPEQVDAVVRAASVRLTHGERACLARLAANVSPVVRHDDGLRRLLGLVRAV
jgi:aryl-alcohol dehydrogenase-like predicted oxidoreductase